MQLRQLVILLGLCSHPVVCAARNPEPSTSDTWEIRAGDTLIHIAENRYGSRAYAGFLEAFNQVDPRKLQVGKPLLTPAFSSAMGSCGAAEAAPEIVPLLCALPENFKAAGKLVLAQCRADRGVKEPRPLEPETLRERAEVQGQVAAIRAAVGEAALPGSLSASLRKRCRRIEQMLAQVAELEGEKMRAFQRTAYFSIERVHRQIDSAFCDLIGYARTAPGGA
ncbi:MAG: hypothetical protein ACR2RV_05120 [Verrucomicrobiales bacterium]